MEKKEDKMSLYIGATALFISLLTVVFLYRELKKVKKDITDIKQIKNQLVNVDTRFDLIDNAFEEIKKEIKKQKKVQFEEPVVEETEEEEKSN